jgi:2-desacetyl-2-hydroxyethyl bacteriochlorophyllide A dehydrogenase
MRGAVLEEWKKLVVREVAIPEIDVDECLIKVCFAGICGSDVHVFNGNNPIAQTPLIPGHEFAGTVSDFSGKPSVDLKIGQRVVVQPLVSCGTCTACRAGYPHVCEKLTVIGVNRDGAFSEYVKVPLEKVIPISDDITDEIATLTEPFAVGYHSNKRGGVVLGDRVLIIGGGPIGLTSGIISRILGAGDVVFTEPSEARLAALVHHGFDSFDPRHNTCLSDLLTRAEGHGYDVVIETSGTPSGMECAIQAARPRGRVVVVGFPKYETAPYNQTRTIVKELTIIGSRVYPLEEFKATVRLLEEAVRNKSVDFSCIISDIRGLEDLQRSLQDIARGETNGKILIKPN